MRKPALIAAAVIAAVAIATTGPAISAPKTVTLTAKLKGANEVPPADPDGFGKAVVRLNRTRGTVCSVITMKRINGATASHVHQGAAGVVNPPFVDLFAFNPATTKHRVKSCTTNVPAEKIDAIVANPKGHYVNVHNADFPGGAIRGQLRKGKR